MEVHKFIVRSAVRIGILLIGGIVIVVLNEITRDWWVIS